MAASTACRIFGDFMGQRDVDEIEQLLTGARLDRESIAALLATVDVSDYFGAVTADDVIDLISA